MHFAKLTERELDTRIADKLLAAGCDQQGREATREWVPMDYRPGWYVQAAEAATDVGQDDDWHPPFTLTGIALILAPWAVGVLLVALASALI